MALKKVSRYCLESNSYQNNHVAEQAITSQSPSSTLLLISYNIMQYEKVKLQQEQIWRQDRTD